MMKFRLIIFSVLLSLTSFSQQGLFHANNGKHSDLSDVIVPAGYYTLSAQKNTSAGVYKTDGTLVRTLWSGVAKPAGTHQIKWDGTDDFKQPLPVDNYNVKVVSTNVQYEWQGTVGNSSLAKSGLDVFKSLDPPNNMVIVGGNAYFTVGYGEGNSTPNMQFALSNPQVKLDPFTGLSNQITDFVCTDGTLLYWACNDAFDNTNSFVYATRISDNGLVSFTNGTNYKVLNGFNYPSVLDHLNVANSLPSGIAVSSTYLFVAHKSLGYISVINKTTGAFVRTIIMPSPTAMSVDGDNIWVTTNTNTLNKYPINSDGTLGSASASISGLSSAVDVRVTGSTVAVVDGGTNQQVKFYQSSNGAIIGAPFGQAGGILNSPVVTNDRFAFWQIDETTGIKHDRGGIAFAPDGSFWVIDPANRRMNHYSSTRVFIEAIIYQGKTYTCYIHQTNNKRVFANLIEFDVNYTDSDIRNSWTIKHNWEGKFNAGYNLQDGIRDITTLSNGRTYGLIINNTLGKFEEIELDPTWGIRYTGETFDDAKKMYADGSIYSLSGTGINETQTWKRRVVTGFNGLNPTRSANEVILTNSVTGMREPRLSGFRINPWEITSSNVLVNFRGNREQPYEEPGSYHLGGMNPTTGQWLWKTSRSTHREYIGEFPADGSHDIGNGSEHQANVAMAIERSIVWGFNGEGWKGSQVNKWNHFYDNGLFLGQFGATGPEYNDDQIAGGAFAGNAFSPAITKEGNDYYMYHNDESVHGGILRWKITGLNTIQEHTISIPPSFARTDEKPELPGVDLMDGLPYISALQNNTAGWSISPAVDSPRWMAKTNMLTYGHLNSPDLYITYKPVSTGTNVINRELNNINNLESWQITGKLTYNTCEPNSPDGNGANQYLDVLDNTGKIILRFYQKIDYSTGTTTVYANNTPVFDRGVVDMKVLTKVLQPLTMVKSGSSITVGYANQPSVTISGVYEAGANAGNPTTMRLYFSNSGGTVYEKFVGISEFRFAIL